MSPRDLSTSKFALYLLHSVDGISSSTDRLLPSNIAAAYMHWAHSAAAVCAAPPPEPLPPPNIADFFMSLNLSSSPLSVTKTFLKLRPDLKAVA